MKSINRKEVISATQIQTRLKQIAAEIVKDTNHEPLLLIGVLTGACVVTADLARELWHVGQQQVEIDFVKTTSYVNDSAESHRQPKVVVDLEKSIAGKNVIIVEDIADTGLTLELVQKHLKASEPKVLKTFALLSKPSKRQVDIKLDYIGFEVEGWIEGYGLDSIRGCPSVMVRE